MDQKIRIPGFSAESSLYVKSSRFTEALNEQDAGNGVIPLLPRGRGGCGMWCPDWAKDLSDCILEPCF